jgi:ABC-2 type transport system ATP-binding protein
MIAVNHLIYEYPGHRAIDDISFSIRRGSITALVGPNGAGKTTLLKCLAALTKPFSGSIFINDLDILKFPRECHKLLGFLPDFFGLYDSLTVYQSLYYFASAQGVEKSDIERRIFDIVESLNLKDKLHKKVTTLSRGMRQRLGVGQAMIHNPELLLLDEPASGLDPEARHSLSELFVNLNREGKTLIVSSHILSELDQYATDMLILKNGRIVESSPDNQQERKIRITVMGSSDNLIEILAKTEHVEEAKIEDNAVLFQFSGDEAQQHELLKSLILSNIAVKEFYVKREGVQEQYLETVGHTKPVHPL